MTMLNNTKSILVTGGTGLVGSHLLYSLIMNGERPRAIFRKTSNRDFVTKVFGYYSEKPEDLYNCIEWIEADILDAESVLRAVKSCNQVYHCAAAVTFDSSQNEIIISNNTKGTANIVRASLETGGVKLCHVSSTAAIGAVDGNGVTNEHHSWTDSERNSAYAISKHLSEHEVWTGIKQGLNAVIVNPAVIFGPGDWSKGSSSFFSNIAKGMPFYTGGITGYVDVRDVVQSMITLMESTIKGERFILCSENLSYHDVFLMIAESLGARKPFIPVPRGISFAVLSGTRLLDFFTGKKSAITSENMRAAYSKVYFDNSKIIRATGISYIPVKQSIEDTVKHYKNDLKLK